MRVVPGHSPVAIAADADAALIAARVEICSSCRHNRGITLEKEGRAVNTVKCALCGCGGLSLLRGQCRAKKWSQDSPASVAASTDADTKNIGGAAPPPQKLLLRCGLSPGDIVMMTAAVRDLHKAHPGRFLTDVQTSCPELWDHNPHITRLVERNGERSAPPPSDLRVISMQYPLINQSNQQPKHFIHGYVDFLMKELGLTIPITEFRGDIRLSEQERSWKDQVHEAFGYHGPFWIMMAGGKYDYTAKWWPPDHYQAVVDHFRGRIQFVQCGESSHWHPPLKGVFSLIGKTSIRQFIRLMYHAAGVVCPVTFAMHLAAAVPTSTNRLRPCVVISGGREPAHWEAYPGHQFLHTIGMLPCCARGGCWRSRCQQVGDGDIKDKENMCERPVPVRDDLRIPQCMTMIKPQQVIHAIEGYLSYVA